MTIMGRALHAIEQFGAREWSQVAQRKLEDVDILMLRNRAVGCLNQCYAAAVLDTKQTVQPAAGLALALACRYSLRLPVMAPLSVESLVGWGEAGRQLRVLQQEAYPRVKKHNQQHPDLDELKAAPSSIQDYVG
jgi:hypothetical protein